ncbi:hypothetical protein [Limisphaera sp. 4302-co]|uniref:hypothetical protein n=1 Tax=Limisphaera sp. 4302-co TaxID=3400417 RepID=UPI003C1B118D
MRGKWMITAGLVLATLPSMAALIDFEADPLGSKPNGWSPLGHPNVTFSDTSGAGLDVSNFGAQGLGTRSLAVHDDRDGSKLQIDFSVPVDALTLWFGNDDPGWAGPTDLAWLEIWSGATLLATVTSSLNLNDVMDQSIGWSGACFDRAYFWYGDSSGNPYTAGLYMGLVEIVDMIEYRPCGTTVPDSGSGWWLLAMGLVAILPLGHNRRARLSMKRS